MPIYEYKCQHCGHQLEILQKITEPAAKTCPECHQDNLQKLVSAAMFKLKGSGWYETDFKDKKPKPDKKGEDSDTKKTTADKPDSGKGDKTSEDKSKKPSAKETDSS